MDVIVVGAGIAGLGAATYFAEKGHRVRVLEAGDRPGGRALTLRSRRGDAADVGTQYYHSSYGRARALMRQVGLDDKLEKVAGATRFFDDRAAGGSFLVGHRLPWFGPAGVSGNARIGWELVKIIRHGLDPFALEEGKDALDSRSALEAYDDPVLREFVLRPLTIAGAIVEPEAAAPSVLHVLRLIKIIVLTDYLTLPGGIASFHEALAARLDVRLGAPVSRLLTDRDRVTGVALEGSDEALKADHVVVATTAPAALRMLPEDWTAEREFLAGITIPPFAFPSFFLDRPLEPSVWSYVVRPSSGKRTSLVIDAARKSPSMVKSGKSVLQPWLCYPNSKAIVGMSDGELIDFCRRELEELMPGFSSWIEEAHVTRHPYAVPFHGVGHQRRALDFLARVDQRQGISFAGDYLSGGYLEPALWSAERAAARAG